MNKFIKILFFLLISFNLSTAFAGTVDHFQVEFSKNSAGNYEALDLTIKAVDKNNDVVTDYTGNIIGISQTDESVELPEELASDEGYSFKLSDQGVKKFENGVKFSSDGNHSISIYDTNDYENLTGIGEISIIETTGGGGEQAEIEIVSPESNTTIGESKVKVSGATKANHQVRIEINASKNISTTSNSDGIFEKEIEDLATGENIIIAYTLDSNENIIGESEKVIIRVDDNKPSFKKIVLSPLSESGSVEEGTNVDVKVFANKGLKSVKLLFNDGVISLSETEDGIYTGKFKAPSKEKDYTMDLVLSDLLGHSITERNVASIKVYLVETNSAKPDNEEIKEDEEKENELDLEIKGLKLVKLKTKSILTWDELEDAESYDIFKSDTETGEFEFLKNTEEAKLEIEITGEEIKHQYFAVKAKTETGSGEIIVGDLSEATKIQTGPTEIILMILLSLILGFAFMLIKRRQT